MASVLIVYTERAYTPNNEYIGPDQVKLIASILGRSGWDADYTSYRPTEIHKKFARRLPQLIFNLAYGFRSRLAGVSETQPQVAECLESTGAVCVGSSAAAQRLVQDKAETADVLLRADIRSPRGVSVGQWEAQPAVCVIKPRYGACHQGVRLVWPRDDLRTILARQAEEYLIQEYIDGPEYSVGLLCYRSELVVLPAVRICFDSQSPAPRLMVGSRFNWTYEFESRDPYGLADLARAIFHLLGLRDYARIDFRVGPAGPVVLDVNSLPNLHPEISLFPKAAGASGINYASLIGELAASAYSRASQKLAGHVS